MEKEGSEMSLDRKSDSRRRIRQIFDMAFGVYIKEEINKTDTWRDIQWGQLWSHFTHEVKEIHDSKGRDRQFHNILDAINLLGMLGAKIVLEEEKKVAK
jgi:hypothetical protein